jgi:uncharacterized membrane protein
MESVFVSILNKKIVNRGFLIGPYCPIYGVGSLLIIIYLTQYKSDVFAIFILGMVICAFIEYVTSYLMEVIFKARWWDYSNYKMNLNGRICLQNVVLFGLGGIVIIYILEPLINSLLIKMDNNLMMLITIILLIIYAVDTIISFNIVKKLQVNLNKIEIRKDSTQELKNLVNEVISVKNLNFLQRRLIVSFPNFEIHRFVKIKNKKFKRFRELFRSK